MERIRKYKEYWRSNLWLTASLLMAWFVVTYVAAYLAPLLNEVTFLGFPLGFYMGAQGAVIVYVILVFIYAYAMGRLDRKYGVNE